jgi:hypothetical protein
MRASTSQLSLIEESRRYARAVLKPGETQRDDSEGVEGKAVRVVLTDAGLAEDECGNWVQRGDVVCTLTPRDARFLAIDLIQVADQAEDDEVNGNYLPPWSHP